ncbi:probable cytosolic oligopeptidase A [Leptopilina heterotoma]|uniref:probable cytosolic oligopeptidase A n=1 Tax=Leptopilina heterotoma TaxID=63436 RepID=UPI001CA9206D|nr:probable cytosolic oligopeptidase A [Leptopilina heterotoma]
MAVAFCGKRLFLARANIFKAQTRNSYIVLLPEIGEDLQEKNPLYSEETKLPDFKRVTFERCLAAVNKQSVEFEQNLSSLEKDIEKNENFNIFTDLITPIEESQVPLESTWGVTRALYFGDKRYMLGQCYPNINRRISVALGYKFCSKQIHKACKNALEDKNNKFTPEQERLIQKFILEGKLNGLELKSKKSQDFVKYYSGKISTEQTLFSKKLEAKTISFSRTVSNPHVMKDFPELFSKLVAQDPNNPHKGPWIITLRPHIVSTFLEYCSDRELRKEIWREDVLKCSLYKEREVQNSTSLENIRDYRKEVANHLGYKTFADMSMETKMAGSLENLNNFFDSLLEEARPAQEREIEELNKFAQERGFDDTLRQWDIPYWSRKQRRAIYQYEENVIQEYFPLPTVMVSMFKLLENLFNIKIEEYENPNVWNEDVRLYNIYDLDSSIIEPAAQFYFDPYVRDYKIKTNSNEGVMVPIRNRSKVCDRNPLAALIFNFMPPTSDKPSLLTFLDVVELFDKFGKALHHLLTKTNYIELAGLSNVEWDASDVSGQFMSNWVYESSVLSEMAKHYKTGEPMPQEAIDNLRNMRTFMAGYKLCEKLYLSRFDIQLHSTDEFWVQIMKRLWKQHFVIPEFKEDSHVCSFIDIFGGNFAAAYYTILWSEMIGADIFSAFQEIPSGDQEQQKLIGRRYKETFLYSGGSSSSNELFRRFRGRDPSVKALLKNLGLKVPVEKQINT